MPGAAPPQDSCARQLPLPGAGSVRPAAGPLAQGDAEEGARPTCAAPTQPASPTVTLDAVLADDLGASAVDIMVLALALEEQFDIDIADHEVEKLVAVRGAVRCAQRALRRRAAPDSPARLTNRQR